MPRPTPPVSRPADVGAPPPSWLSLYAFLMFSLATGNRDTRAVVAAADAARRHYPGCPVLTVAAAKVRGSVQGRWGGRGGREGRGGGGGGGGGEGEGEGEGEGGGGEGGGGRGDSDGDDGDGGALELTELALELNPLNNDAAVRCAVRRPPPATTPDPAHARRRSLPPSPPPCAAAACQMFRLLALVELGRAADAAADAERRLASARRRRSVRRARGSRGLMIRLHTPRHVHPTHDASLRRRMRPWRPGAVRHRTSPHGAAVQC